MNTKSELITMQRIPLTLLHERLRKRDIYPTKKLISLIDSPEIKNFEMLKEIICNEIDRRLDEHINYKYNPEDYGLDIGFPGGDK